MKILLAHPRFSARVLFLAVLAMLAMGPVGRAAAQQHEAHPASSQPATSQAGSTSTEETPSKEEAQEQGFLNAPVVHSFAHALNLSEPTARVLFLIINFVIIALAIVIPLVRMMPKIMRKRGQTLRHNLDEARKASEEARQRMGAVEAKLAGLDREIAAYRAQIEQDSLEDEKRIKASLKEESERITAAAEQEINAAAAHARRTLRSFAADLAIEQAAGQLALSPEADRALINDFIGQVSAEAGNGSQAVLAGGPAAAGKGGKK